jgi:hypothetical protein
MNQTEQDYLDQCEQAFLLFCKRYPDYPLTDANARQMATELRAANLSPTNADHLAVVWQKIHPAVAQVSPAPIAEPSDPIEAEARRMIADGLSLKAVNDMSARELENKSYSKAFCRALELLKPAPEPLRTRGDIVVEEGRESYANKNGIVLDYDPVAAVEATRRAVIRRLHKPECRFTNFPRRRYLRTARRGGHHARRTAVHLLR